MTDDYRDQLRLQQELCRRQIEAGARPPEPARKAESIPQTPTVSEPWFQKMIAEGIAGKGSK